MLVKLDRIFSGRCKNHHLVAWNSVRFQLNYEAMEKGMKRKYSPRSLDIFCWMLCKNKCWQHALPACCKKCTSDVSKSKRKLLRIFHWITFDSFHLPQNFDTKATFTHPQHPHPPPPDSRDSVGWLPCVPCGTVVVVYLNSLGWRTQFKRILVKNDGKRHVPPSYALCMRLKIKLDFRSEKFKQNILKKHQD